MDSNVMTAEERFMKLVEEQKGFEFYQAYRDDVDHVLGGRGNTFWYAVAKKGKPVEISVAVWQNGVWNDRCIKGKGAKKTTKELPAGTVIRRIAEKAYLMQEEKWVKGRKPRLIEDAHPHFHYVYGFGDRAVDVSEKYGVTTAYSDIKDPEAGFHLRYLYTGAEVELPE